jgi:hypothetical protein
LSDGIVSCFGECIHNALGKRLRAVGWCPRFFHLVISLAFQIGNVRCTTLELSLACTFEVVKKIAETHRHPVDIRRIQSLNDRIFPNDLINAPPA